MTKNSQAIHRARAALAAAGAFVALAAAAGCGGGAPGHMTISGPLFLDAETPSILVLPSMAFQLVFHVHTELGDPVAGQPIAFAIVGTPDMPNSDAAGATLSTESAVSDQTGTVATTLTAGLMAMFDVRATLGTVRAEVMVNVSPVAGGTVTVAPFFPDGSRAAVDATRINVIFYDDSACSQISLVKLPASERATVTLDVQAGMATGRARFDPVRGDTSNAIVARARDGTGAVRAAGCVDQAWPVLVPGGTVEVALPLADTNPSPVGRFDVTSDFTFAPALPAAAAVAAPWADLQDCPLDPAQLWLDCTIDALDGAGAGAPPGDPSDCHPGGGEGALAVALAARRGTPIAGVPGLGSEICHAARDAAGVPSLDAEVMGLLTGPAPPPLLGSLAAIAADAAQILAALRLRSELTIATTASPDLYQATHRFDSAELALGAGSYVVPLVPLGAPVLEAQFVSAVEDDSGSIVLGPHGITLRLGTVAREAFGQLALVGRGLPASSSDLVGAIAALADGNVGAEPAPTAAGGCLALDALLCREAGQAAGCLAAACQDGLTAMAAFLDSGFAAADGTAIDFMIDGGSAPLLDRHGTGAADRLGDRFSTPPRPGVWQAELHMAAGRASFTGEWSAERVGN